MKCKNHLNKAVNIPVLFVSRAISSHSWFLWEAFLYSVCLVSYMMGCCLTTSINCSTVIDICFKHEAAGINSQHNLLVITDMPTYHVISHTSSWLVKSEVAAAWKNCSRERFIKTASGRRCGRLPLSLEYGQSYRNSVWAILAANCCHKPLQCGRTFKLTFLMYQMMSCIQKLLKFNSFKVEYLYSYQTFKVSNIFLFIQYKLGSLVLSKALKGHHETI